MSLENFKKPLKIMVGDCFGKKTGIYNQHVDEYYEYILLLLFLIFKKQFYFACENKF